ncbi:membrane protease subunit HflK [Sphingomonas jejuensis]|uniref:Membrane protease subunit HflK n=1 Tax=Sphingomonas jejuensis TaxID=904715 RepID=A0ABX0XHG5_9SPHN|nr:protease modulator HflK [Sphingomonas jejuensis]NJC32778.1 membrane protease subunit HflK [Sphingomonas jejuensis]
MTSITGRDSPAGSLLNESSGGPWGGRGGSGDGGGSGGNGSGGGGSGPRNPWSQPPEGGRPRRPTPTGASALDELLKRGRDQLGKGRFPGAGGGRPLWLIGLGLFLLLWLVFTSVHRVGPQERAVVTRFGKYSGTLAPGMSLTLPAPIDSVQRVNIDEIRTIDIGSTGPDSNLVLTGDQNIIDLAYSVRWNINDPALYLFQLANPEEAVREAAETSMRAVLANVTLDDAIGAGRAGIEAQVALRLQQILNDYRAGIRIQGVAIKQADPPAEVVESFRNVSAAQQQAVSYLNGARAYSQQLIAKAQGEAAAFDRVYEEYRLAPDVTRRRMYYETMEEVLAKVDKTIVEGGNGVTPYLPLPEVRRRAAPAADGQAAAPATEAAR